MLANLGPSLTTSHVSASTASIAGILSGEGTAILFGCTLWMAGSGVGNVSTLLSVKGGMGVDWKGPEWSVIDDPFAFQERWRVVALACDVLPPASAWSGSARVGRLDVLNKRDKCMPKVSGYSIVDRLWNGANP